MTNVQLPMYNAKRTELNSPASPRGAVIFVAYKPTPKHKPQRGDNIITNIVAPLGLVFYQLGTPTNITAPLGLASVGG